MISKLLTLVLFILSSFVVAQNLELVWHKGKPPVDLLYNNNSDQIKLSRADYPFCDGHDGGYLSIQANVTNQTDSTIFNVRLKVEVYDIWRGLYTIMFSPFVDSIFPMDTLGYSYFKTDSLILDQPFWDISNSYDYNQYEFIISLESSQGNLLSIDTITFKKHKARGTAVSTDFGTDAHSFGTNDIGNDGGAIALLLPFDYCTFTMDASFEIGVSPLTTPGGDMTVAIFDSTGFSLQNGFTSPSITSQPVTLSTSNFCSSTEKFTDILPGLLMPLHNYHGHNGLKYYWFVFYFYSNLGSNVIDIYNDTSIQQPSASYMIYHSEDSVWYPSDSIPQFSSPAITLNYYGVIPNPCGLSSSNMEVSKPKLFPNPARTYFKVQGVSGTTATVKVYDANGHEVLYQPEVQNQQAVPLNDLPKGLYLVQVLQKEQVVHSQKLMVQP